MSRPALKVSISYFVADGSIHFRLGGTLTSLAALDALTSRFPDLTQSDVDGAIADEGGDFSPADREPTYP